jgi:hypothetical protein
MRRCFSHRPGGFGARTARPRVTTAWRCLKGDGKVTVHAETEASGRRVPTSGYKVNRELRCDAGDEAKLMTIDGCQQASHGSQAYRIGKRESMGKPEVRGGLVERCSP